MPVFIGGEEAKELLDRYVRCWDSEKTFSSSGKPKPRHNLNLTLGTKNYWEDCPNPDLYKKNRSIGQILGYVDLAGSRFSAVGIECSDGLYIQPDVQVMKSFFNEGIVEFLEDETEPLRSVFSLTDKGREHLGLLPKANA